jgi:hypothetical protein
MGEPITYLGATIQSRVLLDLMTRTTAGIRGERTPGLSNAALVRTRS